MNRWRREGVIIRETEFLLEFGSLDLAPRRVWKDKRSGHTVTIRHINYADRKVLISYGWSDIRTKLLIEAFISRYEPTSWVVDANGSFI